MHTGKLGVPIAVEHENESGDHQPIKKNVRVAKMTSFGHNIGIKRVLNKMDRVFVKV